MRSKFSAKAAKVLAFKRGDEVVKLTVEACPPAYPGWVMSQYPEPTYFVRGKEMPDTKKATEYQTLMAMILIAKSMPGEFDATRESFPKGHAGWEAYAQAIAKELGDAGFTNNDVQRLANEVIGMQSEVSVESVGNSSTPARG